MKEKHYYWQAILTFTKDEKYNLFANLIEPQFSSCK